jgi:hypothetical protein
MRTVPKSLLSPLYVKGSTNGFRVSPFLPEETKGTERVINTTSTRQRGLETPGARRGRVRRNSAHLCCFAWNGPQGQDP